MRQHDAMVTVVINHLAHDAFPFNSFTNDKDIDNKQIPQVPKKSPGTIQITPTVFGPKCRS